MISSIRLDLLEVLGDEYISQHILQSYRDYLEQTSYKVYMSEMLTEAVSLRFGCEFGRRWKDILDELESSVVPEKKTETEHEIKSRLLAKLNGREGA